MNSTISLIIILVISRIEAETLSFKFSSTSDGFTSEYLKDKKQRYKMGEDASATAPNAMAVADGVGGSEFISYYLASVLARGAVNFMQSAVESEVRNVMRAKDKLLPDLVEKLADEIDEHKEKFAKFYDGESDKPKQLLEEQTDTVGIPTISATLIACQIHEVNDKTNNLHILQRGDSLIAVFRPKESRVRSGHFFMYPIFVAEDQQYEFNMPFQFNMNNKTGNKKENLFKSLKVRKGDIVVLGSDGLFDNVHIGFLTYMVNEYINLVRKGNDHSDVLKSEMAELATKYANLFDPQIDQEPRKQQKRIELVESEETTEKKRVIKQKTQSSNKGGFGLFSIIASCFCQDDEEPCEDPPIKNYKKKIVTVVSKEEEDEDELDFEEPEELVNFKNVVDFFSCSNQALAIEPCQPDKLTNNNSLDDDSYWNSLYSLKSNHNKPETDNLAASIQSDDSWASSDFAFMSKCARRAIEKNFKFSATDLSIFETNFDSKTFSESIVAAVKILSQKRQYPSRFYLRSRLERVQFIEKRGKVDDITMTAGLVIASDNKPTAEQTTAFNWKEEMTRKETEFDFELEKDVKCFAENRNNVEYKALKRPSTEEKHQILI
jgi:serine/threonine protein phosphatase PrpC